MTQDEIIRMAKQCGDWNGETAEFNDVGLKCFAALVAAHEREKLAEQEPVAIIEKEVGFETEVYATGHAASLPDGVFKLYAAPVQQAEQEPVCKRCNGTKIVPDGKMYSVDGFQLEVPIECVKDCPDCAAPQPVKQEPVGVVEGSGEWGIAGVLVAGVPIGTKLYAAPVRTKDLTDEEIMDLVRDECVDMRWPSTPLFIARAVIAADREKNK